MYTPASSAAWMIHCPALASTGRPLMLMVTVSAPGAGGAGAGGAVPTPLSVKSGRGTRRTGTPTPDGSDTGQPPRQAVGRERAAPLPHLGHVLVAEHPQPG